ncbi:MAG TPA: phosphatase PAP2 family protein [Chryseosolibacter sp.]
MRSFLVVCFVMPLLANAQVDTIYVKQWDVVRVVDATAFTLTSPARWTGRDFIKAGAVIAGTAAISFLDEPVRDFWRGKKSTVLDKFERMGNHYGKPYSAVAVTGGFYLAGLILKNEWAKETGLILASGLGSSTVVQTFFKNAIGRARPNLNIGNYEADPFNTDSPYHSLPSGHTTVAFTTSLILARQVEQVPIKIFFYSLATLTAASRMYLDVHWVSDIAFGGAIAWFCADAAMKRIEANRFRPVARQTGIIVKMYPYPGGLSLRATL